MVGSPPGSAHGRPASGARLSRRRILGLIPAGALVGACSARAGGPPPSTIRVGLVLPLTGPDRTTGDDMSNGFRLYLLLHGGTLAGHAVDVIEADEGLTGSTGTAAVNRLLHESGVTVLCGVGTSTVLAGVWQQVEAAKVPLIATNAAPRAINATYVWRAGYVSDEPGMAMGRPAVTYGRVQVVGDDSPDSIDQVTGFTSGYTGKYAGPPVRIPLAGTPSVPLAPYLGLIGATRATAVYAAFSGGSAGRFLTAYRSARLGSQLIGPGPLTEGGVIGATGTAAAGVLTALNYSPDLTTDLNRAFSPAYQRRFRRTPTTWAMAAYDAAAVLDRALALTGPSPSPDDINTAIGQVGVIDSPRGTWQFNRSRTPLQKWYLRQVRKDGQVLSNVAIAQLMTLG